MRYSRVNCALGPSKSIRYSGDFVIARFVIAEFVSIYFTEILPGFQMLFVIAGFVKAGFHCTLYFTINTLSSTVTTGLRSWIVLFYALFLSLLDRKDQSCSFFFLNCALKLIIKLLFLKILAHL